MNSLARLAARQALTVSRRGVATTAVRQGPTTYNDGLTPEQRQEYYPKLGNRDIVGFGVNGTANYEDRCEFPAPAVRFKENTADVLALREKEKGDWKTLSLDDKKALYRASFRLTYAEMNAPSSEWKAIIAIILGVCSITGWCMIFLKLKVYPEKPLTITESWKEKQLEQMVRQGQNPITGLASEWDYKKNTWK